MTPQGVRRTSPAPGWDLPDDGRPTGGERPAALLEPSPQGKTERHDGIAYELVLALDAPVLQMVEQMPNGHAVAGGCRAGYRSAEDLARRLCRDTQVVEQLVEVPTIVSWSLLQRIMAQNVGFPVPGGGRSAGLQGFLPGQSSTSLHGPQERISERNVEQIAVSRVGEGLQDFLPGQSSSSSSHDPGRGFEALDEPGYGVFRTFPQIQKSATQPPHSRSELPPHSSPRTPAAYDASMVLEEEEEEEESEDEPVRFIEYVQHDGHWWGASGSSLDSSIAGGWPLPMGPRLAILSGGLHGSSAEGQDDDDTMVLLGWCLVRQWIHVPGLTYCGGASFVHRQSGGHCSYVQRQLRTVQTVQGRRLPCHGAEDVSFGLVKQTTVIPQLQSIDTVFDVLVVQV